MRRHDGQIEPDAADAPDARGERGNSRDPSTVALEPPPPRSTGFWPRIGHLRRGMGLRLLISVLLFSSAVTLTLTAAQLYLEYRYDVGQVERRLADVAEGYPDIIGESLWHLDRKHLQTEIEGILKLPDVRTVEVRETGTIDPLVVSVGQRNRGPVLKRDVPIIRTVNGELKQIGTLHVEATLADVYQRLLDKALIILVSQGAKTFLVSLFIIFIFHRIVTRHLVAIAQFMRRYDFRHPSGALRLQRRPPAVADELDQLVVSFGDLCSSLRTAYDGLQTANAALERDVVARIESEKALREAEQRFRHLFHNMPVALVEMRGHFEIYHQLHADGVTDFAAYLDQHPDVLQQLSDSMTIDEVNDRAVALFRARDASQLIGPGARFWSESTGTLRRALESRFRGETNFEEEMSVVTMDGQRVDVLCTVSRLQPISDMSPTLFGLVDITERVLAREKLQQLEADFAHTARIFALGELTASIAHEINQPLAAIAASSEASLNWLNRPEPDLGEARQLATRILADAHRAGDIIVRVRAMAAKQQPQRLAISLDAVIDEALLFLRHEIQLSQAAVLHRANATAAKALADRTQIQQVIVNLALNALQSMASARTRNGALSISVTPVGSGTLRCAVEDNGPGIRPEHLPELFDSFFTTRETGMGMGLAVCRSIVEAHGGEIGADNDSSLGGARFFFTLPAFVQRD